MTRRARRARLFAAAACFTTLVAGSAIGSDDHFPFGPFRMFANATKPTGAISVPVLTATLADGREVPLSGAVLGLRRAELEGRLDVFTADPGALAMFADGWRRANPEEPEVVAIRLQRWRQPLVDRRPVGEPTVVDLAEWRVGG